MPFFCMTGDHEVIWLELLWCVLFGLRRRQIIVHKSWKKITNIILVNLAGQDFIRNTVLSVLHCPRSRLHFAIVIGWKFWKSFFFKGDLAKMGSNNKNKNCYKLHVYKCYTEVKKASFCQKVWPYAGRDLCVDWHLTVHHGSPATTAPLSSLSVPALVLLHVHHADRHDGMVSGLNTISCAGSCCRCHCWVAILCSSWVRRMNYRACARIFSSLALHNRPPTHLLLTCSAGFRLPLTCWCWRGSGKVSSPGRLLHFFLYWCEHFLFIYLFIFRIIHLAFFSKLHYKSEIRQVFACVQTDFTINEILTFNYLFKKNKQKKTLFYPVCSLRSPWWQ